MSLKTFVHSKLEQLLALLQSVFISFNYLGQVSIGMHCYHYNSNPFYVAIGISFNNFLIISVGKVLSFQPWIQLLTLNKK